ncbi:MAG: arsenosugar biosynthesis radical SAM protein ArsS [Mariprofundaceae bacterium]
MHDMQPLLENTTFPAIHRGDLDTLQVNLGYLCNQRCLHCHVNAGPNRTELMSEENIQTLLDLLPRLNVKRLDLTGGAPEMNPHFCMLVEKAVAMDIHVIDRCNLTILEEPGYEYLAAFLAEQRVEVVASLPCYLEDNVDAQRGDGVFAASIAGLQRLNKLGYGCAKSGLMINLAYNPQGAALPPPQKPLETAYKHELMSRFGIEFNGLFTITNMPIQRFGSTLVSKNEFHDYMTLLKNAYKEENLTSVMCKTLISVDWQGYLYDCDFNQMLDMPLGQNRSDPIHLNDLLAANIEQQPIAIMDHCFACTAGQGSSCGGALDA